MREQGVSITSPHGNYDFKDLHFTEDVNEIQQVDLVLLTVKGFHLQGTLPDLKNLVDKVAKILPLLNGLEHITILQKELGEENVIGGSAFIIATLDEKGHVIHSNRNHDLVYGPLHPSQQEICDEFEQAVSSAIMGASRTEHILIRLWFKYMFITAFSGVTTASDLSIGTIRKYPATHGLLEKALVEMQMLANANGIGLTKKNIAKALEDIAALPDEATSSMHQDRRKNHPLEVEHLQGGALRLAKKANIQLPVIETLYALIKPFEH